MLSLKSFHIVFILASIALCLMVTIWGAQQYMRVGALGSIIMAVTFGVSGVALIVYMVRYFLKLRNLE